jgi:16S rRNA (adenine1518-N6/adenine1519-N6)-dimethyltransferase
VKGRVNDRDFLTPPLSLRGGERPETRIEQAEEKIPELKNQRTSNGVQAWRPRKRLGQHFLRDRSSVDAIISRSGFLPSSHVLEVGPGQGALTLPLSRNVAHVYAVEKDAELVKRLGEELQRRAIENVTLIHQDILRMDFNDLPVPSGEDLEVIGNLPYNISTPFLERLLENRDRVGRAILMFQREVAERLLASPGRKQYGSMTVLIQYHARIFPVLEVSRRAFYPVPKVDSKVIGLDFRTPHPVRSSDEEKFRKVVRGAFSHRRKTLLNSFKGSPCEFSAEDLKNACQACGIDPGKRAETLSIDDFICLSSHLPGPEQETLPKKKECIPVLY